MQILLDITAGKWYNFDMKKLFERIATEQDSPSVIKDFLRRAGLSATLIKKAKFGGILLNGSPVTVRAEVNPGDLIEVFTEESKSEGIPPMDIPLRILYEDEDILAVDKPTNMPTHPSKGNNLPTLANAVMNYYDAEFVFRSVNRLDRDTSGVVIIAKNQFSAGALASSMKRGIWEKKYHAIVDGLPCPTEGTIDAPIERVEEGNIKRCVRPDGKRAITKYKVITPSDHSLCEITLLTGRTHQIRVHMAHIGHPLSSDFLYGKPSDVEYFLRCMEIRFPHPRTGKIIVIKA
jgi:23S rRNA pseudouridine1911/1915/1917 synthase